MPELDDWLHHDGARWRAEIDRRTAGTTVPPFEPPAGSRPRLADRLLVRRAPRTSLLLSAAAITVATLVIGGGVVLASETGDHRHRALPASTTSHPAPVTAAPVVTSPATSPAASHVHRSSPAVHRTVSTPRHVAVPSHHRTHPAAHPRSSSIPATGSSGPTACGADVLDAAVTAPVSAGDHDSLTITATNTGTTDCAVSGFPTVTFPSDPTITVTRAADDPSTVLLSPGQAASAELDWNGTPTTTCTSESSVSVIPPSGGGATLSLDPPAQVCDPGSVVVHALTAG